MRDSGWSIWLRGVAAVVAVSCGMAAHLHAQTFTDLGGLYSGGFTPIQATNGNFYTPTMLGGNAGDGSVVEITPDGTITTLYSFCSLAYCDDGEIPQAALVLGANGDLYGTTTLGGPAGSLGTLFKMTLDGELTTLNSFCVETCADVAFEPFGMIQASNGNFYGTTQFGGLNSGGTLFEMTPTGQFRVVYNFCSQANCTDGEYPVAPPMQANNGDFYGTAGGGSTGGGVIYKLTAAGSYKVIYNFCSQANCADPGGSALVEDVGGNFYGTGGMSDAYRWGVIFKITPSHQYIVLHAFEESDGANPASGLLLANDGNLYGTTSFGSGSGGSDGGGNIFSISPQGEFTSLYSFCDVFDCYSTNSSALFQATNGILYGTLLSGSQYEAGEAFSFNNNLSPLVETVPTMGKVGKRVIILGNNLTGSTSVTFNGVEAAFTVGSNTYIKATVPTGATTGTVSVATPSGTLNSNPQFVVTK